MQLQFDSTTLLSAKTSCKDITAKYETTLSLFETILFHHFIPSNLIYKHKTVAIQRDKKDFCFFEERLRKHLNVKGVVNLT